MGTFAGGSPPSPWLASSSSSPAYLRLLSNLVLVAFLHQFLRGISVMAGPAPLIRVTREVYPPDVEPLEKVVQQVEGSQTEVCIVGDVIYGAEEPVPADQPCLQCKCQPPGVQCETTQCVKKPGCRAIHKPNKCCPEYQCECEHQGRFYANGERLETPPGGECRVCYCRGGELQCADVSCYIRTDCEGTTVPGQCCPKYDHCPPKEPLVDRLISYTTQTLLQPSVNVPQIEVITTQNALPVIEEITNENQISSESQNISNDHVTTAIPTPPLNETEREEEPKITIQEIIPEIKEIPITGPPRREFASYTRQPFVDFSSQVEELNRSGLFRDREDNDLNLGDTESDSSEISEVYHHPPPVLKIGDQLLFLKKGQLVPGKDDVSTPLPVITIIGAEGLQRGTAEDSSEHEDTHIISYVKAKSSDSEKTPLEIIQDAIVNNSSSNSSSQADLDIEDASVVASTERIVTSDSLLNTTEVNETTVPIESLDFIDGTNNNNNTNVEEDSKNTTTTSATATTDISSDASFEGKSVAASEDDVNMDKSSHPLINMDVILPTSVLADAIFSDSEVSDFEIENRSIEQIAAANISVDNSTDRSRETMEDSGENTTPKGTTGLVQDASVELADDRDRVEKFAAGVLMQDLLPLDKDQEDLLRNTTAIDKDVEMIDPQILMMGQAEKDTSTTTAEAVTAAGTTMTTISRSEEENLSVFRQLNDELKTVSPKSLKHLSEEEESDAIFKELLDDATSTDNPGGHKGTTAAAGEGVWASVVGEKESQLLQKVSQAINEFQGKESRESLDTSVLGILRDFFSSQYKYYTSGD